MKTLITEASVRRLYKDATPEFKTTLEDTFGKDYFSIKVTDCETYEELCEFIGENPVNEEELKILGFTQDEICYRKLKTITKALNEGWTPEWSDGNQKKWFPYFGNFSSLMFCDTGYSYSTLHAGNSSYLCFKSKELAEIAGRKFMDIYKQFIFG